MNKVKNRPEYEVLVTRITSGELTRQKAAALSVEMTGLSESTFFSWLRSSGKAKDLKNFRGSVGINSIHSHARNDPDKAKAYEEAILEALPAKVNVLAVARRYESRGVGYVNLALQVRKRREQAAKDRELRFDQEAKRLHLAAQDAIAARLRESNDLSVINLYRALKNPKL